MKKRICIYVYYNENDAYSKIISNIKRFYLPLTFDNFVISNTYRKEIFITNGVDEKLIKSPDLNKEMEFSGYHGGLCAYLDFVRKNHNSENLSICFLNDTIFSHGALRKIENIAFSEWKLREYIECLFKKGSGDTPVALGFIHKPDFLTKIDGLEDGYINSKLFILKNIPVDKIKESLAIDEIQVDIKNNRYWNNLFIDELYNEFLEKWLNGVSSEKNKSWYKSQPLNESNKNFFLAKAKSIIHEHLFSIRMKNKSITLYCMAKKSFILRLIGLLTGVKY